MLQGGATVTEIKPPKLEEDEEDKGTGTGTRSGGRSPRNDTKRAQDMLRGYQQEIQLLSAAQGLDRDRLQIAIDFENQLERIRGLQGVSPELLSQLSAQAQQVALLQDKEAVLDDVFRKTADATQAAFDALIPLEDQRRLLESKLAGNEKEVRLQLQVEQATRGLTPELAKQVELRIRGNAALQEQVDKEQKIADLYNTIGNEITSGIGRALDIAISGTKNLAEEMQKLASDIAKAIGKMLILNSLKAGINALAGSDGVGLFSILGGTFGGGRASGGPVRDGTPYLVGEQGPEIVVPSSDGYVLNNAQTERAMAKYNPWDAGSYSESGGRGSDGISRRRGEISPVTLNVTSTTIADEQWVKVDDLKVALAQTRLEASRDGAKMGTSMTLSKLRNSPGMRRKIGL